MILMTVCWWGWAFLGLSASCSKLSKKFPVISQKIAQKLLKKQSKVMKVARLKAARKNKNFYGLMLKYANCTTKVKFLGIFVQFCGVASVAK